MRARRFWSVCVLALLGFTAGTASAQAPANPAFEVASIKPNKSGTNQRQVGSGTNGRFTAINVPLADLIRFAYAETGPDGVFAPLPPNRLSVAETWVGGATALQSDKFDVVATTESGYVSTAGISDASRIVSRTVQTGAAPRDQGPSHLCISHGAEGRAARSTASTFPCGLLCGPSDGPTASLAAGGFVAEPCKGLRNVPGKATGRAVTIQTLARLMSGWVDDHRPVEDRTGLTGNFDIDLDWTPDRPLPAPPAGAPALPPVDAYGAGLFTALQEQLGLKVESTKNSIDILVVDHADPPTERLNRRCCAGRDSHRHSP